MSTYDYKDKWLNFKTKKLQVRAKPNFLEPFLVPPKATIAHICIYPKVFVNTNNLEYILRRSPAFFINLKAKTVSTLQPWHFAATCLA